MCFSSLWCFKTAKIHFLSSFQFLVTSVTNWCFDWPHGNLFGRTCNYVTLLLQQNPFIIVLPTPLFVCFFFAKFSFYYSSSLVDFRHTFTYHKSIKDTASGKIVSNKSSDIDLLSKLYHLNQMTIRRQHTTKIFHYKLGSASAHI